MDDQAGDDRPDRPIGEAVDDTQGPWAEIVTGIVLLVIAAVGGWSVRINPQLVGTDYGPDPGPGMLPQIAVSLLALSALALIARAAIRLRRDGSGSRRVGVPSGWKRISVPALMVATLLIYAQAFPVIGFFEATVIFAAVWTIFLGVTGFAPTTGRAVALYVAEAAIITALVWLVFAKVIKIPLP